VDDARQFGLGKLFTGQRVAGARMAGAESVVDDGVQLQAFAVQAGDSRFFFRIQRRVEGLHQHEFTEAVDAQARPAFGVAVEQAVGVGVFL